MTTNQPDGIVWQEPPPSKGGGRPSTLAPLVEELRRQQGRWALVGSYLSGGAVRDKLRNLGCEVTQRTTGNGRVDLYARWPEDKP